MSGASRITAQREEGREKVVRQVPCPVCSAKAGDPCFWEIRDGVVALDNSFGHTGRYLIQANAGLVPQFAGRR